MSTKANLMWISSFEMFTFRLSKGIIRTEELNLYRFKTVRFKAVLCNLSFTTSNTAVLQNSKAEQPDFYPSFQVRRKFCQLFKNYNINGTY